VLPYPSILRRYLATVIDGLLPIIVFMAVTAMFQKEAESGMRLHIGIAGAFFLIYEPFCTSKLCTIGQLLFGMRVRRFSTRQKISLPAAYARFIVKWLLGFISFFIIGASENRRTIHDLAAGSIVIDAKEANA
jgi:uncharacterized RDD family membrane protein YckC